MRLSERLKLFSLSPTLALSAKATQLRAQGLDVISFAAGEPDFLTPLHIQEAAVRAMEAGQTKYTAIGGTIELKESITRKLEQENHLRYQTNEVIVSCGAKHSLYNAFSAILNEGDEVIVPAPYWVSYVDQVSLAGGRAVVVPCSVQDQFLLSAEKLTRAISPRTRMLILNSPANPSGSCYLREQLEELGRVLLQHPQIIILSDDIYEKILYEGTEFCNLLMVDAGFRDRFVLINGVSKCYSMTGWRIGYAAGPAVLIQAMEALQSQVTSNPNSIAQAAAVAALTGDQSCVAKMNSAFARRRAMIATVFAKIPEIHYLAPKGAFYAFPNIEKIFALPKFQELCGQAYTGGPSSQSKIFSQYLLESANVAVVPGIAFGDDHCFRMSFALSDEELGKGLQGIADAIAQLRH